MTDDMGRLLRDASDDTGRPIGFPLEDLVTRGRRRVRARRTGFSAVAGVAVVGLAFGTVTWSGGDDRPVAPADSDPDGVVERCAALDRAFVDEVGADPDRVPPIDDWSVRLRDHGDAATSFILARDEGNGRGYAYCRLGRTGGSTYDDYFRWGMVGLGDMDFDLTEGRGGHVVVSASGSWLWREGYLEFETADGKTHVPARKGPFYLWQYELDDVDPTEPVMVTYYRPNGTIVGSQNINDPRSWDNPKPDLPGVEPESNGPSTTRFEDPSTGCWLEVGRNDEILDSGGGSDAECREFMRLWRKSKVDQR